MIPSFAILTVHPGSYTSAYVEGLANLYRSGLEFERASKRSGPLIAMARNELVRWFVRETELDVALFIDSDIAFTPENVTTLLGYVDADERAQVRSGFYRGTHYSEGRSPTGETFPVGNVWDEESGTLRRLGPGDHYWKDDPIELAGVGMGFCAIDRKVLTELQVGFEDGLWPFAETEYGPQVCSEDLTFCQRARKAGAAIILDPRVHVGHVKSQVLW